MEARVVIYRFDDFTLDTRRCELSRGTEVQHLEPQVYATLCHLLEHRDRLVTRDELLDHIWGHRFVTPGTLNTRIKSLRQALGDDGVTQRFIRTVRGRGFRFAGDVSVQQEGHPTPGVASGSGRGVAPDTQQIRFCRAADGVRIAYAVSGDGPPLVKPANWLTHLEYDWKSPVWRHWLDWAGSHYTLLRYDERGCGLSDHDIADFSFDRWVDDLEAVVDARGLERFPLFGVSQGCAVAVAYAVRHPDRVSKLVLYGGYACGRNHRSPSPQQQLEAAVLRNMIRVGWGRDNAAFRNVFGMLFVPEGTTEQFQWFCDMTRTVPVENAVRIEQTAHNIDVRDQAGAVRAPTLVLHARRDAMIPFEAGRMLATLIPDARFVPLDSCNHVLLEDEPAWQVLQREVEVFLAG
jgi:pimeloyl-ACP methyl ester carboxylesterase/DNA-binding winged helix-turn-helix (wHTH) protein